MKRVLLLTVAAVGLSIASESTALAGFPNSYAGGLYFGGGFGRTTTIWDLYRTGQIPVPPYFALNPPVYYSYPVPRTYGHSPWPYPGDVRTPDPLAAVQPAEIVNPYFNSSTEQPAPEPETTVGQEPSSGPLVINNPYASERSAILQVAH